MTHKAKVNPTFDNFVLLSPKQVEFAIYIRQFRRIHELSQREMATLCNHYGKSHNVKISAMDISNYENYKNIPTPPKFSTIMNTMDLDPAML